MKKSFKVLILTLLVVIAFVAGGSISLLYLVSKSPEEVTATVQNQLQKNLGVPVTIEKARFEWKSGPRVILSKVDIDQPGVITLHIRSITAYLSLWKLFFGDVGVRKVRLIMPTGTVDLDNLKNLKARDSEGKRPAILIWKGSLKLIYQGADISLADVSGRITSDWANLRARTLGGRVLLETDLERPGKLTFDAYAIQLDQLDGRLKGTAHANISVEDTRDGQSGSFSLQVKGLSHPWVQGTIDRLSASASLTGERNSMRINDIVLKTPFLDVSGRADVSGFTDMASWQNTRLNLELSSREFDYEEVVSLLPLEKFPGWLRTLLSQQIRSGRSRFSTAQYHGPLKGFISGVDLLDNIHVVQELKGQSFGAGHVPERLTGITGQVMYGTGDIRFLNLTGMMGSSRLTRVDIVFPRAMKPLMRVGVDVDVDMPAPDFLRVWRAAMVPGEVLRLLEPVSRVKAGHIKGRVRTVYDEELKNRLMLQGDLRLDGCSFQWKRHAMTNVSGTYHSEGFSKPQVIALSGSVDNTRIRRLNASIMAPFGESISTFTLLADRLPPLGKLTPEDAFLKISGKGRGHVLSGTMELNAPGMALERGDQSYRAKAVTAQGEFTARLGSPSSISFGSLVIRTASSRLEGKADIRGGDGSAELSGRVDLKDMTIQSPTATKALSGAADGNLSLSWGDKVSASGIISLQDAALPLSDDVMIMNGDLVVRPSLIAMNALNVRIGDVRSTLSGELTIGEQPHFKGMITVEGMTMDGKDRKLGGIKDLRADARLRLVQCVIYGLPVENATAEAALEAGELKLDHIVMETVSGTVKGTASLSLEGKTSFDLVVSLRDSDLRKILKASNRTPGIDGALDLEGRVWGSSDTFNGNLTINATDGEIRKYALVSQIFSLLNVYKIYQHQDTEFLSRHFTYNRINCTFTIRDNTISYDDFLLDSNSIQISAVGKYFMDTRKIDAVIGVQPLETVDKTISMIPLVGWVLTGDNGKFIVISMNVGGTLDDPKVRVAPVETLSGTVASSLLRSLKLPGKLFDDSLRFMGGEKK
ncbi:MAG TPA: AsmA-like C-terminal domain-containing protein [Desulfomonilia bacterium]|nr:AsmA-like C-terminal domain-containing protein [Desulfomonilia bacterium]